MPSPILPSQFGDAVPSANADFCDRFTKWLGVPALLRDLFSWLLTPEGNVSPAFQAEVALYASPTGTVIYCLTQNVGDGYLLCDGREVLRSSYPALFQAIGTRFGDGNSTTTFNLPDGRGRHLIGAGAGAANTDFGTTALTNRNIDDAYAGEEQVELTEAQNGEHMHASGLLFRLGQNPTNSSAVLRDQTDKTLSLYGSEAATVGAGSYFQGVDNSGNRSETNVGPSGSGAPHNNVGPSIIGFMFIKT